MARKRKTDIFTSILYIIVGVLLAWRGDAVIDTTITIIGVLFIIFAIFDLIRKNWLGCAVSAIVGILIIIFGNAFVDIAIIVLGVLIAIKGLISLISVLSKKRKNALQVLFPVLTIVLGIALAFSNLASIIIIIVGVLLAIDGVLGLIGALKK